MRAFSSISTCTNVCIVFLTGRKERPAYYEASYQAQRLMASQSGFMIEDAGAISCTGALFKSGIIRRLHESITLFGRIGHFG